MLRAARSERNLTPDEPVVRTQDRTDERSEAIRRAVWSLREAERELIVLRYFDGFSQAQISSVLGISPQAVNGKLVRAKRKIAEYLKRNGLAGAHYESAR
jgi:RNA polymerase sigma-70 factor (ECF subfamily)